MIIDIHTHIFPKKVRADRSQYTEEEPAFALLYSSPKARMSGAAEIIEAMDKSGIDKSVVFGFPWKNMTTSRMHNDYIMEAAMRYPDRLVPFCCVDAMNPEAPEEVTRCLDNGFKGVGELAFYESGIPAEAADKLGPIMNACQEFNVPILIHTNEPVGHKYPGKTANTLAQIEYLVKAYPENRIILAHMGGGIFFYAALKRQMKEILRNVYFDTAAAPFLYDPIVYQIACMLAGPEKILFGTDFPLIRADRYIDEFNKSGLKQKDIDKILGKNAEELLNITH